jgi:signal transduction histidine kinase
MSAPLHFKISSALKDIIGKDLITDDYIAVFELVKNAYDAHAKRVDVIFNHLNASNPSISIIDDGKGMDLNDLRNKWLFVAYSAKKEGTEDIDYRDRIYQNRPFAGAKGIGRFSCDRLGKKLKIETTKEGNRTEILLTDWEKFEEDLKEEFVNISVEHSWTKENSYQLDHGTILNIFDLRSTWDREKLLKLKDSLAKLITPSTLGEEQFEIFITAQNEENQDSNQTDDRYKVNGKVTNFIFETLGLKTTKIKASISEDGRVFTTELIDGGTSIYSVKEQNKYGKLKNINFTLYYLNQSAKITFARRMGLASRLYGHVFLYKNGFRIYPFGEPYEDPLKIDERKSRKQFSRLGTSELIGQIEIFGTNPELKETSSRGGGLISSPTYEELKLSFIQVLERLEKYVVDVQEWGLSIEENMDEYDDKKLKIRISELIKELTDAENIIDFNYNENFVEILQTAQDNSAQAVMTNLKRIAHASGNDALVVETKKIEKKLNVLRIAKEQADKEIKSFQEELIEKESQNLFLKSIKSQDLEEVLNLMHHIGISTSTIQNYIKGVVFRIDNGVELDRIELKEILGRVNMEVNKIYSISRFATRANFKVSVKPTKVDLEDFIREYLINVVQPFLPSSMHLTVLTDSKPFIMEIRPIELTILIDNLVNNSRKVKAKNIKVSLNISGANSLTMSFRDDGIGIAKEIQEKIFDYGFTTTEGSGLGLAHVKDILNSMGSNIVVNSNFTKGAEFIITFKQF